MRPRLLVGGELNARLSASAWRVVVDIGCSRGSYQPHRSSSRRRDGGGKNTCCGGGTSGWGGCHPTVVGAERDRPRTLVLVRRAISVSLSPRCCLRAVVRPGERAPPRVVE